MEIDGDPSMKLSMEPRTRLDSGRVVSLTVATATVNAIPTVCAAAAGPAHTVRSPALGRRVPLVSSYRVIQWGTGNVGRHALRGILERPELAARRSARVQQRQGRDGMPASSSTAVRSASSRRTTSTHCWRSTPTASSTTHSVQRWSRSSSPWMTSCASSSRGRTASRARRPLPLPAARRRAEVPHRRGDRPAGGRLRSRQAATLYSTGMTPGFALDLFPITLTRVSRDVEHVRITEVVNLRDYRSSMM